MVPAASLSGACPCFLLPLRPPWQAMGSRSVGVSGWFTSVCTEPGTQEGEGQGKGGQALNRRWIPPKGRPRAENEGHRKVSLDDFGLKGFEADASGTAWGESAFWASFYTHFQFNSFPHTFFKACAVVGRVEQAEQKPCPHEAYMLMERDGKQDRCTCHAVF